MKTILKKRTQSARALQNGTKPISYDAPILSKYQHCIEAIEKYVKQNNTDIEFLYNENSFIYKYANGEIYNFTGINGGSLIKGRSCDLKKPNDSVKAALKDILKRSIDDMDELTYKTVARDCSCVTDDIIFSHGRENGSLKNLCEPISERSMQKAKGIDN